MAVPSFRNSAAVQNTDDAGVCFGADGPPESLPQLFLHLRDNHSLDVLLQAGILLLFHLAQRVGDGKRQPRQNQGGHHIPGEIPPSQQAPAANSTALPISLNCRITSWAFRQTASNGNGDPSFT